MLTVWYNVLKVIHSRGFTKLPDRSDQINMIKDSSGSTLYYTTSSRGSRFHTVIGIGCEYSERSRLVFHLTERVHAPSVDDATGETLFMEDAYPLAYPSLPMAVSGPTTDQASGLIHGLAKYALHPFHPLVGIRISASPLAGYASRVTHYVNRKSYSRFTVADLIAEALGFDPVNLEFEDIGYTLPSERERRDRLDYDLEDDFLD